MENVGIESRPEFKQLEDWLRGQMQGLIKHLLQQEVTEFLGRAKSVRGLGFDSDAGTSSAVSKHLVGHPVIDTAVEIYSHRPILQGLASSVLPI